MKKRITLIGAFCFIVTLAYYAISCRSQQTVDFSTQVKPILNKKCISCHGGVKKQGGFSLLFEEEAKAKLKSGNYAIVPGDVSKSQLISRLTLSDPEERMPYKHDPLGKEEIEILTNWVKEGAKWGEHWAYKSVEKQEIPQTGSDWAKNDIDRFVFEKAESEGLKVSAEAKPEVLARRVALDIIGFPAPDSIKNAYLQNPTEGNYEKMVDQLLASPHYGEKWAAMWLDLARYADTKGYERDDVRSIWYYRDWLIKAFNADMPYNQFITEQLAGDLLPNPTEDQYIATAFHRNTMTNDEGGTDNEEFRVAAVIDRVNTTWETLMGTTFACVQCHSHPYDPFRHEDYYRFMAYFNNTRDADTFADYPLIRHFNSDQKEQLNRLSNALNNTPEKERIIHFIKTLQPALNSLETDSFINSELSDTKWLAMRNNSSARIPDFDLNGVNALIFRLRSGLKKGFLLFHLDKPDGEIIGKFTITKPSDGWENKEISILNQTGRHDIYLTFASSELADPMKTGITFDWFHFTKNFPKEVNQSAKNDFWELVNAKTETTPILLDNTPEMSRETHVFERGSWLSKGTLVKAGVPASLNSMPKNAPENRLGLANWMTDKNNPLVSRTLVNRLFEQLWGIGLVETLEDMGTQGLNPSNQALLDHLSWKFMNDYNWSIKKLLKEMVMSAAYRQDSKVNREQLEKDPVNRFMARGPRVRLSAEQVRDQVLMACGKMNTEMYGPSVMPYQPDGVWDSPYSGVKWIKSEGNEQYRRAIYTYWKRTSPYPSMINFDMVGREVCSSRRIRTNTPLQALTTLNDSVYIDLSAKMVDLVGFQKPNENISKVYSLLTGKKINVERAAALKELFDNSLKVYQKKKEKIPERQAMILVANAILNLDEVITKS